MTGTETISPRTLGSPTLAELADEFELSLKAQNCSPATQLVYLTAVRQLDTFLHNRGMPATVAAIHREHVETFLAHIVTIRSPATAATRHGALRRFFGWAVDQREITRSPMERVTAPRVPEKPVPVLRDDQLKALITATEKDRSFYGRRDASIVMLFADTGARLSEIANLRVGDVDLDQGFIWIRRGKGGKQRTVPFGNRTARAVKRWLRVRSTHRHAGSPWLWIGSGGRGGRFGPDGIRQMIPKRGRRAAIDGLHPHMLRHTFASSWMANGGLESDLMRIAGWSDRRMLVRYGAAAADQRAHAAHRRLGLFDRL